MYLNMYTKLNNKYTSGKWGTPISQTPRPNTERLGTNTAHDDQKPHHKQRLATRQLASQTVCQKVWPIACFRTVSCTEMNSLIATYLKKTAQTPLLAIGMNIGEL